MKFWRAMRNVDEGMKMTRQFWKDGNPYDFKYIEHVKYPETEKKHEISVIGYRHPDAPEYYGVWLPRPEDFLAEDWIIYS